MRPFIFLMFWLIVLYMIVMHFDSQERCNQSGGIYTKPAGEFFYRCEPDDLQIVWSN